MAKPVVIEKKPGTWEICTAPAAGKSVTLAERLNEGWEPFSVGEEYMTGVVIYLKRRVPKPAAEPSAT